jgi:uncharacterized protein YjbI with pentapeptide repeats
MSPWPSLYTVYLDEIFFLSKVSYLFCGSQAINLRVLWLAISIPGMVYAADPDDYLKLKETGVCRRCNLERVDLQGAQLKGVNLGGTNLRNSDLTLTNLESANLGGADLRGANLDRAFMNEAILCNTIMPDGNIEYSGCLLPTLKQLLNVFEQR